MNYQALHRGWRVVRIPLAAAIMLFLGLVIYRIPAVKEQERTKEAIEKIRAQKLTLADVTGEHLPPEPDPRLNDSTVEGVDANANGIRDDVELAIFRLHPDSAKIRAAELQYAMELQNEMTNVFNGETLVAVMQEEGRGFDCLFKSSSGDQNFNLHKKEVRDFIFNTDDRRKKSDEIFDKYMTSFAALKSQSCDIELASLPN